MFCIEPDCVYAFSDGMHHVVDVTDHQALAATLSSLEVPRETLEWHDTFHSLA